MKKETFKKDVLKNNGWSILLLISSILATITEFIPWMGDRSAWDLYLLKQIYQNYYVYIFPLITGILVLITLIYIKMKQDQNKTIISSLSFITILNLFMIFMIEAINLDPKFVWNYAGIYIFLLSLFSYLFGIVLYFSEQRKNHQEENG